MARLRAGDTFYETGGKMQPVREDGGEKYLKSKPYNPWAGEDLVQVAWERNARKLGAMAPGQLMTWLDDHATQTAKTNETIAVAGQVDAQIRSEVTALKQTVPKNHEKSPDHFGVRRI